MIAAIVMRYTVIATSRCFWYFDWMNASVGCDHVSFFDNAHCFSKFSNHITAMIVSFLMYFFSLGH